MKTKLLFALSVCLMTACTLTPEQQAARQAKQIKAGRAAASHSP